MKALKGILFMLLAQSAQAAMPPDSVIKLQVTSVDPSVADTSHQGVSIDSTERQWLAKSERVLAKLMVNNKALAERLHNERLRHELLHTIYYEAKRAGLEPDLVLSVIRVESNFRKYAISSAGALGLMQVMPFWQNVVGAASSSDLFNLRTNLRLGCAILRSYLDKEQGNIHRALERYNGSLGNPDYPNLIYAAWVN